MRILLSVELPAKSEFDSLVAEYEKARANLEQYLWRERILATTADNKEEADSSN